MGYDEDDLPRRRNACIHGMPEVSCGYCGPKTPLEVPGSRISEGAMSGIPQPKCLGCHKEMAFGTFYRDHRNCVGIKDHPILRRREAARLARIAVAKRRGLVVPDDLYLVCSNYQLDRFATVEITDQRSFVHYLGTGAWASWGAEIMAEI